MSNNFHIGIPESDLPVKQPSGAARVRYVEDGKSYSAAMPDVVAAAALVEEAIDGVVSDAEAQVRALLNSLGYLPPVAFTGGLNVNSSQFTVTHNGVTYAPVADQVPFTTTGTFNPAQWRVIQGITYDALSANSGAALVGYRLAAAEAITRPVSSKLADIVSVKDFGAVGDGVTNDAPAIQKAINYAQTVGGNIYFPHGVYLINQTINVDLTGNTVSGTKGVNIHGDGSGNTKILNATNNVGVDVYGTMESMALYSYFRMSGIMIGKVGAGTGDIGLRIRRSYGVYMDDVVFDGNTFGMTYYDCVLMTQVSCHYRWNSKGLLAGGQQVEHGSTPNAVTFLGCIFYGQANYCAWFEEGCNVVMIGGSVETTRSGSDANKFGLRFNNMGRYGQAAVQIFGTYFEINGNVADIWITAGDYSCSYLISGCGFARLTDDPALGGYSENCIRLETNSNPAARQALAVNGCAFSRGGTYQPSASRPYIAILGSTPVEFRDVGNRYMDNIERPTKESGDILARVRFNGSGALIRGYNIASVVRNSVGNYTITFRDNNTTIAGGRTYNIAADIPGYHWLTAETSTGFTIQCANMAGANTDPGGVSVVVYE